MRKKKQSEEIRNSPTRSSFVFEELEPRVLLSADLPVDVAPDYNPDSTEEDALWQDIHALQTETAALEEVSRELVFVDTDTPDYQQLVDDMLANSDASRNIEVVVLDQDKDGIEEISEFLSNHDDLDAVHIISHGSDGSIELGNTSLNSDTLEENNLKIALWANAFAETGDILIYGCNLAETEAGQSLINNIYGEGDTSAKSLSFCKINFQG